MADVSSVNSLVGDRRDRFFHNSETLVQQRAIFRILTVMKPQHDQPASGPEKPSKPSGTEQARRIVEEYADDLREILKMLRKLFN